MNNAHLHLLINHFPIIGPVFGLLVLIAGFLLKNKTVKRTALGVFIFSAVLAFPANFTGEEAEEMVEHLPGISDAAIHAHEEAAEVFLWMAGLLGLVSVFTLILDLKDATIAKFLYFFILIAAVVVLIFAKQTGTSGGEIRHPEILQNDQNPAPANGADEQNGEED